MPDKVRELQALFAKHDSFLIATNPSTTVLFPLSLKTR